MTRNYWRWLLAVGLGTFLGLVAAQWLSGLEFAHAESGLSLACKVEHMEHPDPAGTQFFQLKCADGISTLSIDGDLPLAQWLKQQRGTVDIDLRPRALQRIER